ncbi:MAG TPA: permease-like cell division protein FtsX [Cryptosporangiaceae bacterium]|nr:permease-like cell division protein FtsX [Cryptosporangiaceae bacterium]
MRAKFVLTEAATGLWRNVTMTIALILTTAISLALLAAGGLLYYEVGKTKDLLYGQVEVSIFFDDTATKEQQDALRGRLEADTLVRDVRFETKQEAYEKFKALFKDDLPVLVENTKPDAMQESYRVKLKDPEKAGQLDASYDQDSIKKQYGIDRVRTPEELIRRLFDTIDAVKNTAFVISLIQGIAAVMLIANTIQVAAYSRRREVSIMKLVGASNWYVRLPFVLEAALAGLIGAVVASLVLVLGKVFLLDGSLKPLFSSSVIPEITWTDIAITAPILCLVSVVVAALTGWNTLRFYVKV